jgi:hypothetical protein
MSDRLIDDDIRSLKSVKSKKEVKQFFKFEVGGDASLLHLA